MYFSLTHNTHKQTKNKPNLFSFTPESQVCRVNEETQKASGNLEEDRVRTCLTAADEIGMVTEYLTYFRELVDGPYNVFVDQQFKKAVEIQNHERAIRLAIKSRDLLVEDKGSKFQLSACKKLKAPSQWAKEKGFFGDKEKLALNFLKWQKDIIHSPLTESAFVFFLFFLSFYFIFCFFGGSVLF